MAVGCTTKKVGLRVWHRHYIRAYGTNVACMRPLLARPTRRRPAFISTPGLHRVITDESGAVAERLAYDPGANGVCLTVSIATPSGLITDRGFTQHEHLDEVGLIHMNGRSTTRCWAGSWPHTFIKRKPTGFRHYSINNPLAYTDPTGHFKLRGFKGPGARSGATGRKYGVIRFPMIAGIAIRSLVGMGPFGDWGYGCSGARS